MEIIINDGMMYKQAIYELKKQWLKNEHKYGESLAVFARRVGIDRKTARTLFNEMGIGKDIYQSKEKCLFCSETKEIELHHVYGRKNSEETIPLCNNCHAIFHAINRRYSSKKINTPLI